MTDADQVAPTALAGRLAEGHDAMVAYAATPSGAAQVMADYQRLNHIRLATWQAHGGPEYQAATANLVALMTIHRQGQQQREAAQAVTDVIRAADEARTRAHSPTQFNAAPEPDPAPAATVAVVHTGIRGTTRLYDAPVTRTLGRHRRHVHGEHRTPTGRTYHLGWSSYGACVAYDARGNLVGALNTVGGATVHEIRIKDAHQRRGLGTALWTLGRHRFPDLQHAPARERSEAGASWVDSLNA